MTDKLTPDRLNAADRNDFIAALGNVFEYSPWIAEAVETKRPFPTIAALCDAMLDVMAKAEPQQRLTLLRAHPDLANKTQRAAGLTEESVSEQDGAGLDRLSEREFTMFEELNSAYKQRFGFPFILCVRRHTRDSILDAFARRLQNTRDDEEQAAISEIGRIATLRLAALVEGDVPLPVYGELSMHVLDTHSGRPAEGVAFELIELARHGASRTLKKAVTNRDGRTDAPLIHGRPVPIGNYELRFHVADYFAKCGVPLSSPPFLDIIPIRFGVSEPAGHYHVPLLMTPWSFATYRGS
jgi:2-oxo-4-hydroxy-4-carboxy-5-ureidoimidazoline decarboxylase